MSPLIPLRGILQTLWTTPLYTKGYNFFCTVTRMDQTLCFTRDAFAL